VQCTTSPLKCWNGGTCFVAAGAGTTLCQCPSAWGGGECQRLLASNIPPAASVAPAGTVAVPKWVAAPIVIGLLLLLCFGGALAYLVFRERRGRPVFARLEEGQPGRTRGLELHTLGSGSKESI